MKIKIFTTCPYCSHEDSFWRDVQHDSPKLFVHTCDNEEGGCDLPYVVSLELKPVVTTLEIGGMMDEYREDQAEKNYDGPVGLQHP